ncbi:hypothetical protein [Deinococcus ficus]|uniref:hypothetical protein n=1 Tax=Deinococcus ficus TaxID=317577 RepID=UPI0003B4A349|nr:hypothetical protein [Deinococcus ficus]
MRLALLLTSVAAAQTIPNMQPANAAQRQAISRNAKAFTGRTCVACGFTAFPVPADASEAMRKQAAAFAVDHVLKTYAQVGIKVTRLRWGSDGGAEIYLKDDPAYMQVTNLNDKGRRYTITFGCQLK